MSDYHYENKFIELAANWKNYWFALYLSFDPAARPFFILGFGPFAFVVKKWWMK